MNELLKDYSQCLEADGLQRKLNLRNLHRYTRRTIARCWFDRDMIELPRIFCQNSGGCASSYIVQLLIDNGIEKCFHELAPDLNQLGLEHFERSISQHRIVRLLRYTRHDVFFEANNRLFSLSKELRLAFPRAKFIHLHRHPADSIRSAMSKPDVDSYLQRNVRFQGELAGPKNARALVRFCHYWNNMNRRIVNDLAETNSLSLKFTDLISGKISALEDLVGQSLPKSKRATVNQGQVRNEGRYPAFKDWDQADQREMLSICGHTMNALGYQ